MFQHPYFLENNSNDFSHFKGILGENRKQKFVDGIDEKSVDQNKPPNGNVRNREVIRQNLIFPLVNKTINKLSEVHH